MHLTAAFAHLAANCLLYIPNFAILILVNDIHEISVLRHAVTKADFEKLGRGFDDCALLGMVDRSSFEAFRNLDSP